MIEQIADIEHSLTTIKFSKHGCLYFKEDLPVSFRRDHDTLLVESLGQSANLHRYTIGPLSNAELWCSGREDMGLDRGPCKPKFCLTTPHGYLSID